VGLITGWLSRYMPSNPLFKPPSFWPVTWWQQGYRIPTKDANAAVEAAVGAISQTIAMLPIAHYRENKRGGSEVITDSACARVLRKPNKYQTKADFFLNLVRAELMRGNGYALGQRNGRTEIEAMHLVQPTSIYPFISPHDGSIFYQFSSVPVGHVFDSVVQDLFRAEDVLHIRMHTPMHPLVGESPILAAALAIESGNAISEATAAFHRNMARPSGYLKVPGTIKPDVAETLRKEWQDAYNGISAGRIAVLQNGVEWTTLSMNAVDAELIENYKMSIADIARVFRVPLAIIGDNTSTYNNTEVLMKFWLSTGLGFMLEHIELALDAFFELPADEWVAFDTDYLQRADFAARIEALTKGISGGLYAPDEARGKEGLPRTKYGDEPRLQAQVVPLSFAYERPEPAAPTVPVAKEPVGDKALPAPKPKALPAPKEKVDDIEEEDEADEEFTVEQMKARYEELAL
jgi:HK97 family phage portal protein